jgi:hypothetical protein
MYSCMYVRIGWLFAAVVFANATYRGTGGSSAFYHTVHVNVLQKYMKKNDVWRNSPSWICNHSVRMQECRRARAWVASLSPCQQADDIAAVLQITSTITVFWMWPYSLLLISLRSWCLVAGVWLSFVVVPSIFFIVLLEFKCRAYLLSWGTMKTWSQSLLQTLQCRPTCFISHLVHTISWNHEA